MRTPFWASPAEHIGIHPHATFVDRDELDYPNPVDGSPATIVSLTGS
jgi:hypothetical protein